MTGTAPAAPTSQTYVNLPVADLAKSTAFWTGLGLRADPLVSDERTTCVRISAEAAVMLHTAEFFREFTGSAVADPATSREVVVGLSAGSREQVDRLVDAAVAAGGTAVGGPVEQAGMYMRAFRDLDGHQWSSIHLDWSA